MNSFILPKNVAGEKVENVNALRRKKPFAVVLRWDKEWQEELACVNGGGSLFFDFGKEMNGGVRIITGVIDGNTASVRIRFGESRTEVESSVGEKNATNDHSSRDFTAVLSAFSDITYGATGFRYARIDFLEEKKVTVQNVYCENHILSKKANYVYYGEDKRISEIFSVAKRTVDLCSAGDFVVDGIKRDRLVWIGDMHPEMLALTALYGRVKQIENSLELLRDVTPKGFWMNGSYPSYSMWWIIIVADYYKEVHCADFAKRQLAYIGQLLQQFNGYVSNDGELQYPAQFVDWQTCSSQDVGAGMRSIHILAVKKAIWLLKEFSQNTDFAEELLKKLKRQEIEVKEKKQVIALKYFAEETLSEADYERLIEGGAKGLSTFMSYYILTAIASKNKEKAIEIMKEYYGAMLDKGATTFWEDFDIAWVENSCRIDEFPNNGEKDIHGDFGAYCYKGFRHSLCHGWSSGVIKFIKEICR